MSKSLVNIGYVLVFLGVLIISPLGDLLPVGNVRDWLSLGDEPEFVKIISYPPSYAPTFFLVCLGLVAVYIGKKTTK